MGLFSKKKKQKVPKKLEIPQPGKSQVKPETPKLPKVPSFTGESVTDKDLKEAIKPDLPPKTEFDAKQVKQDIKYIDEILDNDLDLNSEEIQKATINKTQQKPTPKEKTVNPKIKQKPKIPKNKSQLKPDSPKEKTIHPKIKQKLEDHNEVIHIDVEDQKLEPVEEIKPVPAKKKPVKKEIKKQETEESPNVEVLPDFENTEEKLEHKTKQINEKFKEKKQITGDLFVKSTLYREALHTNLALKEKAKICAEKLESMKNTIETQTKRKEKLKENLEFIQDNLMLIEEKLFNKNPYLR